MTEYRVSFKGRWIKMGASLLIGCALISGAAMAQEVKPAIVFDLGGKFDKSFNEGIYNGGVKFTEDTGISVALFEISNETQRVQALRRMAQRGQDPVLGVGFGQGPAMEEVASAYPDTQFAIIDMVVDKPNVRSIVFKEHEGSFLVGFLAAMKSQSKKVGFVGGMDVPLIRKFACGYVQGAKYFGDNVQVFQNMTGSTPAAWNDPSRGAELARDQFGQGADVVYAAAGGTGLGVYQAAKDEGKYAIGVDSNQNYLHPGTMLTSMIKRVDVAAYDAFTDAKDGKFSTGVRVLGLAEDGVGWALDEHNRDLVSGEMENKVEQAREDIVSGKIKVHDYMSDNNCPVK